MTLGCLGAQFFAGFTSHLLSLNGWRSLLFIFLQFVRSMDFGNIDWGREVGWQYRFVENLLGNLCLMPICAYSWGGLQTPTQDCLIFIGYNSTVNIPQILFLSLLDISTKSTPPSITKIMHYFFAPISLIYAWIYADFKVTYLSILPPLQNQS